MENLELVEKPKWAEKEPSPGGHHQKRHSEDPSDKDSLVNHVRPPPSPFATLFRSPGRSAIRGRKRRYRATLPCPPTEGRPRRCPAARRRPLRGTSNPRSRNDSERPAMVPCPPVRSPLPDSPLQNRCGRRLQRLLPARRRARFPR